LVRIFYTSLFSNKTISIDWPTSWQKYQINGRIDDTIVSYLDSIRLAENKNYAILLLKNIDSYPSLLDIQSGYIDIWWIIHDGGLLFLLAFLFQQHHIWNKCILRLFTICLPNQDPDKHKHELEQYVYQLRIHAEVHAVIVDDQEVSAFTKYRTMTVLNSKHLNPFDIAEKEVKIERDLFENYPASKVF
jgi:potassium/chloride transporter 4/5/6